MSRPRVIFINRVYRPSLAATAQLLTDLAEGLAARAWEVHVIAAGHESGSHHGVTLHRTGEGEQHGGLISRARNYRRFIRQVRGVLQNLLRPGDVVVALTDPPMLGASLTDLVTKRGARMLHWIQDIYPEIVSAHVGIVARAGLFPLRIKRDAAWRRSETCIALGETMADFVAAHGMERNSVTIVPNWAPRELHEAAEPAAIAAQREAWGLADKLVVAYSGNLGRVHEFNAILDAATTLRDRPEFAFLFIGTGAQLRKVESVAASRQLTNVRILPPAPRSALAVSLSAADVQLVTLRPAFAALVYPSKLAGVLAAGKPVIFVGPSRGEIAALLQRADCGASFAPSDGAGIATTLIQWQANPAQRAALAQNARRAYEQHFRFESALARWEDILAKNVARA